MNVVTGRTTVYCRMPCLHIWTNSCPISHGVRQQKGKIWFTCGLISRFASSVSSEFR